MYVTSAIVFVCIAMFFIAILNKKIMETREPRSRVEAADTELVSVPVDAPTVATVIRSEYNDQLETSTLM